MTGILSPAAAEIVIDRHEFDKVAFSFTQNRVLRPLCQG